MSSIPRRYRAHPRVLAIILLGDGRFRRIYRDDDYALTQYADGPHPYGPFLSRHSRHDSPPRMYFSLSVNGQRIFDGAMLEHSYGRSYPRLNVYRVINPHQATFFVPDCTDVLTSQ